MFSVKILKRVFLRGFCVTNANANVRSSGAASGGAVAVVVVDVFSTGNTRGVVFTHEGFATTLAPKMVFCFYPIFTINERHVLSLSVVFFSLATQVITKTIKSHFSTKFSVSKYSHQSSITVTLQASLEAREPA